MVKNPLATVQAFLTSCYIFPKMCEAVNLHKHWPLLLLLFSLFLCLYSAWAFLLSNPSEDDS